MLAVAHQGHSLQLLQAIAQFFHHQRHVVSRCERRGPFRTLKPVTVMPLSNKLAIAEDFTHPGPPGYPRRLQVALWHIVACFWGQSPPEWTPVQVDGVTVYPSAEEAEYSASLPLSIAIAVSWWAARMGYAVMAIPKLPLVETVGRRSH